MGPAISFLVMMTLFFTSMAQSGSLSKQVGYGAAISCGVVAMVLAAVRYKQRKDAGE